MKKRTLSKKALVLVSAALFLSLLPVLALGFYAVPMADDFSYGVSPHLAFKESGSLFAAVAAAAEKTVESYFGWQGSFSAIFIMALHPAVFSESLYFITPFIMLGVFLFGSILFCRAFFGELMGLERPAADFIAALVCFIGIQLIPSPVQGLYWFNGASYYMVFHGLLLMGCGMMLRLERRAGRRVWPLCIVALLIGGGNYVTALTAMILGVLYLAFLGFTKNRAWKSALLPVLILTLAFAVSVLAPGNAIRQVNHQDTPGAIKAVLISFGYGLSFGRHWFSLPLLGGLVFAAFTLWPFLNSDRCSFRFPAVVSLFSYCLFSAMFCPPVYALGSTGDTRLLNIVYLAYVLLLFINLVYWLAWCKKRFFSGRERDAKRLALGFAAGLAAFCLCCVLALANGLGFCSAGAMSTILSGEAREYYDCAQRRFEILNDSSIENAELERFSTTPYFLYLSDVSENPDIWPNTDVATFYGKESVVLASD